MPFKAPAFLSSVPPWAILGLGVVTGAFRSAWAFIYQHTIGFLINKTSLTITVEDCDNPEAYAWMSMWVERHLKTRGINSLLLRRKPNKQSSDVPKGSHGEQEEEYSLIPGYGTYYMKWRNRFVMVDHWPDENPAGTGALNGIAKKMHWLTVHIWFTRDREMLMDILAEAKAEYMATMPPHVKFYRYIPYDGWNAVPLTPRSLESAYFPQEQLGDLMLDIQTFLTSKDKYEQLGVPYRRGYQLDGPPGTGKSTLILAIASELNLPLYSISLQSEGMDGERLSKMLSQCAKPSIVVFEDIDCINASKTRDAEADDRLTMSDLLNAIDGIGASEGRLVFMTANHPEVIDEALTRSGRIDRKFTIDYAEDEELKRFYDRVSPLFPVPEWEDFRASLPEQATIADAQAMAFRRSAAA